MNEGSRHEKAVIVAVSYITGFTAAYILFSNFTSTSTTPFLTTQSTQTNTASVVTSVIKDDAVVVDDIESTEDSVLTYQEGRLEVNVEGQKVLLSINPEINNINLDTEDMKQGYHYGEISYAIDASNSFVFFCEKHVNDNCLGYVYDINSDRIYPVTKSGTPVQITEKSATEAIFTTVGLKIGSNYSANPSVPWILISGE